MRAPAATIPRPMIWLLDLALLAVGFLALARGANWLVEGSSELARRLGVSALVIGLSVVAWGTSAPEVVVSGRAAFELKGDLVMGNVLGSNAANIGLVLGACALVLPSILARPMPPREAGWMLTSLAALWAVCADRHVGRIDGALLLALFALNYAHLAWGLRRGRTALRILGELQAEAADAAPARGTRRPLWAALLGAVLVCVGAELVVRGASGAALRLGMTERVIALTIVAFGTSLPELSAGLASAFKGEREIGLGNVVGSNVFNVLAVVGIAALVRPVGGEAGVDLALANALALDFPVVLAFSLAVIVLPVVLVRDGGRLAAAILLAGYLAYVGYLFV